MNEALAALSSWPREIGPWALDIAAKATILLVTVWLADRLVVRRALLRSALWHAVVVGLAVLPLAGTALPRLPLAWLPGNTRTVANAHAMDDAHAMVDPRQAEALEPEFIEHDVMTDLDADLHVAAMAPIPDAPKWPWRWDSAVIAFAVYSAVVAALIARLTHSLRAVASLRRASSPLDLPLWRNTLAKWQERLKITQSVELVRTPRVAGPLVVGWRQPMILVPDALAESSAAGAIDAILLHELAHIRRGDYAWNLSRRWVQIAYWPHPLTWFLSRPLAAAREQACDALCVYWLGDRCAYVAALVEVAARVIGRSGTALGMAMAAPTRLARRLERIEASPGMASCLPARTFRLALTALVVAICSLLGAVKLGPAVAAVSDDESRAEAQTQADGESATAGDDDHGGDDDDQKSDNDDDQPTEENAGQADEDMVESAEVVVTKVIGGAEAPVVINEPCTVESGHTVDIYPRVTGIVSEVSVEIGELVKKDQRLGLIESLDLDDAVQEAQESVEELQAALESAEAALAAAKAAVVTVKTKVDGAQAELRSAERILNSRAKVHGRLRELANEKAVDRRALDEDEDKLESAQAAKAAAAAKLATANAEVIEAEAHLPQLQAALRGVMPRLKAAQRRLARAKTQAAQCELRAPIDGMVAMRNLHIGDLVRAEGLAGRGVEGAPLFAISSDERMVAIVKVPDLHAPRVRHGDSATIVIKSLAGKKYEGRVSRTARRVDPTTRTMRVEIDLRNPDGTIYAGMNGNAAIHTKAEGLLVPAGAIVSDSQKNYCRRVAGGLAVKTPVELGLRWGSQFEVVEGLAAGDTVVTEWRSFRLRSGNTHELQTGEGERNLLGRELGRVPDCLPIEIVEPSR
jgi:RND family efflux transporter MFP subunit